MRRKVIAGNWKMNMTPSQAVKLVTELRPNVNNPDVDVVFCVPSIDIVPVVEAVKGSNIHIGAENVYYQEKGAFTGELSPEMLVDAGVSHVIIGHSERRMYFNESNTVLNLKMHKVLEHLIILIICCGETLEQREKGITLDFVKEQIVEAYVGVTKDQVLHTIVAYEPIWAIGTGKVATTAQAQEVCGFIRTVFEELYDKETADQIRILYGGSVNASNAAELFAQPDIDGGLVGGASLKPDFADIFFTNVLSCYRQLIRIHLKENHIMSKKPVVLMVLDGYGLNDRTEGNAIAMANTPVMDKLMKECPFQKGYASGLAVGLPDGQMGNSEVGHMNIGAGRIIYQDLTRITKDIEDGTFFKNEELLEAMENCKKND